MKMRTILAPVTVFYNGQYAPPGTPIELPEDEARSLIERHGEVEPGGELTLTEDDLSSIDKLNRFHAQNS